MKLSEILENVDTLVPNSIGVDAKIAWMNQVQNQLYRDYQLPESVKVYVIRHGQQLYVLPGDCPEDRLTKLVIGRQNAKQTYPFVPDGLATDSDDLNRFCTVVSGTLMIYPAPTEDTDGFLFYYARPMELTLATLNQEPTFPKDFHELLVFGCAARVAKSIADLNRAAVFDQDYRVLAEKADLNLRKRRQTKVLTARTWM